jgi:phosphoribosylformylglycinamidine synthase subunit PurSL
LKKRSSFRILILHYLKILYLTNAFRIEIRSIIHDSRREVFLKKIKESGFSNLEKVSVTNVYTVDKDFSDESKNSIGKMLINPIIEDFSIGEPNDANSFDYAVEIGFLPGVTDNLAHTVIESISDLLKVEFDVPTENVYSSQVLFLKGVSNAEEAEQIGWLFGNALLNRIHVRDFDTFVATPGMDIVIPKVALGHTPQSDSVNLDISDDLLEIIGKKGIPNGDGTYRGPLALRMSYLKTIQDYFKKEGRKPTDIELEAIAQTWSEHCKHTIFADPIDEVEGGLYKSFIKKATQDIRAAKGDKDFCVSVFTDNSGGIIFDENYLVTDKAETHNSPSALDPYGGAITGIVGVNRDALGFGMGSKPVMNRYGYCFGDPETNPELYRGKDKTNPMLSPRTIMDGVVRGVNNGANESGIPSPQGFVYFDDRYNGKPLVFVGTVGLIPRKVNGKDSSQKSALPGDRIVVAGGRVGLDGIHGATFSSEALDTGSPSTAVQIGDPITQRKLSDVIIKEARDMGFYNSITDNGAGGISCSIAEMAKECGGCDVELDKVPLKYPNLSPWEIWISESQERMTFSVPPEKVEAFIDLMARRGVEANDVGEFTDSGRCVVKYNGDKIVDLEMEFLHDGLPAEPLTTSYEKPVHPVPTFEQPSDMNATMLQMIQQKNVAGFRYISRQYDHEVQGGSVIKPLQGKGLVNGTANVIRPLLESNKAVVTSQGINARYSDIDTYSMAAASIDDAIAAAVAAGGDVDYMAIMDNFCWCSSNEEQRLGELKAAAQACYDVAVAYGTPYISGKDSMFNDFKGFDKDGNPIKISIPPTLLVSALSVIPEATKAISMDFKNTGDLIYVLGDTNNELGAGEYFDMNNEVGNNVPQVNTTEAIARYRAIFKAAQQDLIASMISIEKGGLGVAAMKTVVASQLGATIDLSKLETTVTRDDYALFSESKSRFLVSVSPTNQEAFEGLFSKAHLIGEVSGDTSDEAQLNVLGLSGDALINLSVQDVSKSYHSPFKDY